MTSLSISPLLNYIKLKFNFIQFFLNKNKIYIPNSSLVLLLSVPYIHLNKDTYKAIKCQLSTGFNYEVNKAVVWDYFIKPHMISMVVLICIPLIITNCYIIRNIWNFQYLNWFRTCWNFETFAVIVIPSLLTLKFHSGCYK